MSLPPLFILSIILVFVVILVFFGFGMSFNNKMFGGLIALVSIILVIASPFIYLKMIESKQLNLGEMLEEFTNASIVSLLTIIVLSSIMISSRTLFDGQA